MRISMRGWSVVGMAAVLLTAAAISASGLTAADGTTARGGQLTEQSLGNLLSAMGLNAKKEQQRYDFTFKALHQGNEWELSMSAVLSQNGDSVWVMAWLDELPRSASDVPRQALLRLLALNDTLGQGKFFAYVSGNRRFVLQRVVKNENLSTASVREILQDLGSSVVQTYPYWTVENWKAASESAASGSTGRGDEAARTTTSPATQSRRVGQ